VRDNYKVLTQRAGPQGVRPIVVEQAAFSSEREQVCREYAREGAHGFCHARYTEARLASLANKLGLAAVAGPRASSRNGGSGKKRAFRARTGSRSGPTLVPIR
jgi:hypothetical protein